MATLPEEEPENIEDYYSGLPGRPKLLARSNPEPWVRPRSLAWEAREGGDPKAVFVVTHHPLREKLDQGLRAKILDVLATMTPCKWISVDYVRMGYDKDVERNNPVIALVTVEEDQLSKVEAKRVVDAIAEECRT